MRTVHVIAVLIALAGCAGKEDGKSRPAEAGFQIDALDGPVKVLNGQSVQVEIKVRWKDGSPEDVELSATVAPANRGVSATVKPATLAGGEGTAQVDIRCGETAPSGDYKVTVTGKTTKGGTATKDIAVTVPPID
jgi:hypothetical protein